MDGVDVAATLDSNQSLSHYISDRTASNERERGPMHYFAYFVRPPAGPAV